MKINTKTTRSAGGVVVNNKEEILVVSQRGVNWSLPKGHIDPGEDKLEAAKREIYEESGIKELELIKKLGYYKRYRMGEDNKEDKSELKKIYLFLFKTNQINLKPVDPHNPEAVWLKPKEAIKKITHQKDKEFLSKVIKELK